MGTFHIPGSTLKGLMGELLTPNPNQKVLKSCFRGNPAFAGVLWSVWETKDAAGVLRRIIRADILQYLRDEEPGWSYRPLDERDGPVATSCPVSYLKLASGPGSYETEGYSPSFRTRVLAKAAERKAGKV